MVAQTFRNRIIDYGVKPADQFLANPKNARVHPQFQRDVMKAALEEVGFVAPVIESKSGVLLDGHERIWQAMQNDNANVPFVVVDVDEAEEDYVLATFDPITSLANYDAKLLDDLLRDVNSDQPAIQQMLVELAENNGLYGDEGGAGAGGDAGALLNRAEQLRDDWGVERGQLWIIGRHRLLCGDSYSTNDIDRLTDGFTVDMLHTDPPYGINIVQPHKGDSAADSGGAKPFGSTASSERKGKSAVAFRNSGKVGGGTGALVRQSRDVGRVAPANIIQSNLYPVIEGDDRPFDPTPFLNLAPIVILWGANYFADKLPVSSCWICWDKREDITRNNFADCELAWSNMDKPARVFHHLWNGLHKGSQHGQRRIHPTEKPVALFENVGNMYCHNGVWLDLFAGSGAQLEAAEKIGATCLALEYEPLYVACVLQRLADMGLTPELQTR